MWSVSRVCGFLVSVGSMPTTPNSPAARPDGSFAPEDCATTKCAKPRAFDKVSVAYTGRC